MKLFAIVPAAIVLVSLCGSPVPPPPGAVSGAVLFDANHNGIRDSCDTGLAGVRVVASVASGEMVTAETDASGNYELKDVPAGDAAVGLLAGVGTVWPLTHRPGPVSVSSSKTVTAGDILSAAKAPLAVGDPLVQGVIFQDNNGNGRIDVGECPLITAANSIQVAVGGHTGVISDGAYQIHGLYSDAGQDVTFSYTEVEPPNGDPAITLRPTSGVSPAGSTCRVLVSAAPRYGGAVYEANVGFGPGPSWIGGFSGTVFADDNENGTWDEDESAFPGVAVTFTGSADSTDCAGGATATRAYPGPTGSYFIAGLAYGDYAVSIIPAVVDSRHIVAITSPLQVKLNQSEQALDIPVKTIDGATVRIHAFDDANGNGLRDPGETPVPDSRLCLGPASPPPDYIGPYYECSPPDSDGLVTFAPLDTGSYRIDLQRAEFVTAARAPDGVTVKAGDVVDIDYPLDVVTPAEQVIQPGAGVSSSLDICYSDPGWVQPPFDEEKAHLLASQMGLTTDQARLIYGHGIYEAYTAGRSRGYEPQFWSEASAAPPLYTQCASFALVTFALVNYEPLDVALSAKTGMVQVRLARRDAGLTAINLPWTDASPPFYLFVDEDYQPIVRCASAGLCQWDDGSRSGGYYGYGGNYVD